MKIFYSKKYNGFFIEEYSGLPEDAVEISEQKHQEFISGKKDYEMKPGTDGMPVWVKMEMK